MIEGFKVVMDVIVYKFIAFYNKENDEYDPKYMMLTYRDVVDMYQLLHKEDHEEANAELQKGDERENGYWNNAHTN